MAASSKTKVKVDFTETEERKGAKHYKPGDYGVKVIKAEHGKSKNKGTQQISFEMKFLDGKYKGSAIYLNCNLLPQSLWVLRNALEAMGFKIGKKVATLDLAKCKGKKLGITVEDDEYDNKVRSRVVDTFPLSELEDRQASDKDEELDEDDDEDDEDEEDEDDDDEDDDDEDEDLEEVDLDDV